MVFSSSFALAVALVCVNVPISHAWDNGLARTPPMGWCSWNGFHRNFNESLFYAVANALSTNGMSDAGYKYVNVDGGWWAGSDTGHIVRNMTGFPTWNTQKYPNGIPKLVEYIHSKGLKYGHYTDAGKHACNGDAPMSEGFEFEDASLFAQWGADMLKVDACGDVENHTAIVARWRAAIEATGRPILFSNCHNGCQTDAGPGHPDSWLPDNQCERDANMWRSSADISATWSSMLHNLDSLKGRGMYAYPGAWYVQCAPCYVSSL